MTPRGGSKQILFVDGPSLGRGGDAKSRNTRSALIRRLISEKRSTYRQEEEAKREQLIAQRQAMIIPLLASKLDQMTQIVCSPLLLWCATVAAIAAEEMPEQPRLVEHVGTLCRGVECHVVSTLRWDPGNVRLGGRRLLGGLSSTVGEIGSAVSHRRGRTGVIQQTLGRRIPSNDDAVTTQRAE